MRVLISNDDGVFAEGIRTLAAAAVARGHEVVNDLESAGEGPRDWPSDVAQIHNNCPSLTPIQPDLFWRGSLSGLPQLKLKDQLVR